MDSGSFQVAMGKVDITVGRTGIKRTQYHYCVSDIILSALQISSSLAHSTF